MINRLPADYSGVFLPGFIPFLPSSVGYLVMGGQKFSQKIRKLTASPVVQMGLVVKILLKVYPHLIVILVVIDKSNALPGGDIHDLVVGSPVLVGLHIGNHDQNQLCPLFPGKGDDSS